MSHGENEPVALGGPCAHACRFAGDRREIVAISTEVWLPVRLCISGVGLTSENGFCCRRDVATLAHWRQQLLF